LKGYIPEHPFEARKFSVDSLKSGELKMSQNGSENSLAFSVGSDENDHANNAKEYKSQILIVSDKRDRQNPESSQITDSKSLL